MQSASSRIWTRITVSISYDDNHYTTGTSGVHNGVHTFRKGISPKLNVIVRLGFELDYFEVTVQHFTQYTDKNHQLYRSRMSDIIRAHTCTYQSWQPVSSVIEWLKPSFFKANVSPKVRNHQDQAVAPHFYNVLLENKDTTLHPKEEEEEEDYDIVILLPWY